jgi:hypothetical protein
LNLSMKFAIYHRMREWAHELGDPQLAEVDAPTKEEAERLTAHLGETGTWAVSIPHQKVWRPRHALLPHSRIKPHRAENKNTRFLVWGATPPFIGG